MIIDVMQHSELEGLGAIVDWAEAAEVELRVHRLDEGEDIRALNPADMDGLLILGGPTSVNDDDAWIAAERILIRSLDKLGRPVFGICFGAQQIVRAFGAPVFEGTPEMGFSEVTAIESGTKFTAFHWHEERMAELPGAVQLFTNDVTPNQGFKYHAHIRGLQFHLEVTADQVEALAESQQVPVATAGIDFTAMHERLNEQLDTTFMG